MANTDGKRDTFLIFGSPLIEEPEIAEVVETLRSGWVGTGPRVARFEEMFRERIGSRFALGVNSCTAALHLAMLALDIGAGDMVVTTPMTFAATANSILHTGATPVFADVDRRSMNLDPGRVERFLEEECRVNAEGETIHRSGKHVRALMPVHFAGRPCDMDALLDLAERYRLLVIEDAAHAIESVYKGRKIGALGDAGCFSFYVTKNITTGEGGMLTTDREEVASRVKIMALHGLSKDAWKRYSDAGFKHYQILTPGFKYNMMDLVAAIGVHQLPRLERYLARREAVWRRYDEAFADLPLVRPAPPEPDTVHARHLYTVLVKPEEGGVSRDDLQQRLYDLNIGTGIHFVSLHLHEYYRHTFGHRPEDFPNALFISERTLSLPLSPKLTDEDVEDVIAATRRALERKVG